MTTPVPGATLARRPRRRPLRWTLSIVVVLVVAVLAAGGSAGADLKVPGVPFTVQSGVQSTANGSRLSVLGAGHDDDGAFARVALGGYGGPVASMRTGDWLCSQTWGCVILTSVREPEVPDVPVGEPQAMGGPSAEVVLIYVPPPWRLAAIALVLAGTAAWWARSRRRLRASASAVVG